MLQEIVATSIDLGCRRPAGDAVCNDHARSQFARAVAHMLETHLEVGGLARLIFLAPGPVLDELAAGIPDSLKRMVVGELAQDMMTASSAALRDALRSA